MAPGVFCVWSHADPDADTQVADGEDEWLFTDDISSLQGVAQGVRLEVAGMQSTEPPYTHDIPFLTMYDLPDVSYAKEKEFEDVARRYSCPEAGGLKSHVYEEIECIEAEYFKGGKRHLHVVNCQQDLTCNLCRSNQGRARCSGNRRRPASR
jgi:hypothetical protein